MTTPQSDDPFGKTTAQPVGQPGSPYPPGPGFGGPAQPYGPPQQGYPPAAPRRRQGSFGPALIVAAVGLVLQAVSQLIYWPSDDYSLDRAKFGTAVSAVSWVVLAVAAVLAAVAASRRDT